MGRWRWLGLMVALAVGCGLNIEGTGMPDTEDASAGGPDAEADTAQESSGADSAVSDGSADGKEGEVDASPPFCDAKDATQLACFRFDDNLTDESPAGRTSDTSTSVAYVAGVHGRALAFTAATQLRFPATPAWPTTPVTIEMWVKPGTLPATGRQGFIDKDQQWGVFFYAPGTVTCSVAASVSSQQLTAGVWTHVACVATGQNTTIYINGNPIASAPSGTISSAAAETHIGSNSPDFADSFVGGAIDDLRILNVARTAAEVLVDATP